MAIERIFLCDGPDCERHVRTANARPPAFLTVREGVGRTQHFCSWDCILRHAATKEPEQIIAMGSDDPPETV